MPLYEYECDDCGAIYEFFLKHTDSHSKENEECRCCPGKIHKIVSKTTFRLGRNGSVGWADNGYGDNVVGNTKSFRETGHYHKT